MLTEVPYAILVIRFKRKGAFMKYMLFRFPDALEWDDEDKPKRGRPRKEENYEPRLKAGFQFPIRPELAAVEYGESIFEVTENLIRAVSDELSGIEEYSHFPCGAFAPDEPYAVEYMTDDKFDYEMSGFVSGYAGGLNKIIYFGIKEIHENHDE